MTGSASFKLRYTGDDLETTETVNVIVTLGAQPGIDSVFLPGVVEATENLLIVSGSYTLTGSDGPPDVGRWSGFILHSIHAWQAGLIWCTNDEAQKDVVKG